MVQVMFVKKKYKHIEKEIENTSLNSQITVI